jgi:hypothetical protein
MWDLVRDRIGADGRSVNGDVRVVSRERRQSLDCSPQATAVPEPIGPGANPDRLIRDSNIERAQAPSSDVTNLPLKPPLKGCIRLGIGLVGMHVGGTRGSWRPRAARANQRPEPATRSRGLAFIFVVCVLLARGVDRPAWGFGIGQWL